MTTLTNFTAEAFDNHFGGSSEGGGKPDKPKSRAKKAPAKKAAAKKAAEPKVDPDAVPEGTTEEVLNWVGDDADRAQRALDAENESDKPRVTLVEPLEKQLAADDEDEDSKE